MEPLTLNWAPAQPAFVALLNALAREIDPVYVVGGVVRDALLKRTGRVTDLDVVVTHAANQTAQRIADRLGWAYYALDADRDVARLVFTASRTPLVCDIAAMRGGDLTTDLQARDFTVNAMAMRWRRDGGGELFDLTGGQADLTARQLRRVTPWSLAEDPVRLLRAVRLAVQLGFTIEDETLLQIQRISDTVRLSSPERVRDELWKMLASATPDRALEMLRSYNLLRPLLPEIADMEGVAQTAPHDSDVYQHTLRTVRYAVQLRDWLKGSHSIEETPAGAIVAAAFGPHIYRLRQLLSATISAERQHVDWLVWLALWHDVGKPEARSLDHFPDGAPRYRFLGHEEAGAELAVRRLESLKFSRYETLLAQTVIRSHMRPHHLHASFGADALSRRACYRFFRDAQGRGTEEHAGIDTVMLALADYQAIYAASPPPAWATYVRHMGELVEFGFSPDGPGEIRVPLVDGHMLMGYFKLKPGKKVGALLEQLREAQAVGEITTPEEGLALAAALLSENA